MQSGIKYTFGEGTKESKLVHLESAGYTLNNKHVFYIIEDNKDVSRVYLSDTSIKTQLTKV